MSGREWEGNSNGAIVSHPLACETIGGLRRPSPSRGYRGDGQLAARRSHAPVPGSTSGPVPPSAYAGHCSRQGQDRCYRRSYSCRPVESWFVAPSLSCTSVDSGTASTLLTPSPLRRPALPAPHPVGLCPPQHPAQPRVFVQYPQVVHGLATSQVQQKQ